MCKKLIHLITIPNLLFFLFAEPGLPHHTIILSKTTILLHILYGPLPPFPPQIPLLLLELQDNVVSFPAWLILMLFERRREEELMTRRKTDKYTERQENTSWCERTIATQEVISTVGWFKPAWFQVRVSSDKHLRYKITGENENMRDSFRGKTHWRWSLIVFG